ncbi:hypothetical protein F5I97DRAFT_644898 [Phlebopus sp. FC_14]|nr:hypothetical protein F5I97DRAFT_644898 [Phlebopus sp. FC_14]
MVQSGLSLPSAVALFNDVLSLYRRKWQYCRRVQVLTFGQQQYFRRHQDNQKEKYSDLDNEAKVYCDLEYHQGVIIPKFYGYFKRNYTSCILLEDCGDPVIHSFRDCGESHAVGEEIVRLLLRLHKAGFEHRNFWPCDVAKQDNNMRIVSLRVAQERTCGVDETRCMEDSFGLQENYCGEFVNVCSKMDLSLWGWFFFLFSFFFFLRASLLLTLSRIHLGR